MTNNYKMAEKRLHGIERKINANSEFAKKYKREMAKYLLKDYARELSTSEISYSSNLVWYVPHFAVQTVHKPDKLRIVFDVLLRSKVCHLTMRYLKVLTT